MKTWRGKLAASNGGKTRALRLSAERRREIAAMGAAGRVAKKREREQALRDLVKGQETGEYTKDWFDQLP